MYLSNTDARVSRLEAALLRIQRCDTTGTWREIVAWMQSVARAALAAAGSAGDSTGGSEGVATAAMVKVNGKRFFCECGANVFMRRGDTFTCNGCGAEYDGSEGATVTDSVEIDRVYALAEEIAMEARRGMAKFAAFNSPHEGKSVIEEELDELWEHVKANTGRSADARQEAIQVAAMALRYAHDLCGSEGGDRG